MRTYSDKFKEFLKNSEEGKYKSPREVPPSIFASDDWNYISRKEFEQSILLPFIRHQVERALTTMSDVYKNAYREAKILPENINSIEDFWKIPPLPKDATVSGPGLREKVLRSGYGVVKPNDLEQRGITASAYFSGGTKGIAVPTWVTEWDLEVETQASYRGLLATGIKAESVIINTYNTSHKGGLVITKALCKLPSSDYIQVKTTDKAQDLGVYIERASKHGHELLFVGAQPKIAERDTQAKGSGRQLFDVISECPDVFDNHVDRVLLGGFRIIPEVEDLSISSEKPITTIFGSTEVMPCFFGTPYEPNQENPDNPKNICVFNNLHEMLGPHYIEVIRYDQESRRFKPTKPGEPGVLALTTIFREGTNYLRYIIGDQAVVLKEESPCSCGKSNSRIINDIERIGKEGIEELLATGCAVI